MSLLTKIFSLLILFLLGLIFYANRSLYFSKFDAAYWTDKFEHSQWRLASSSRVIGDDGLYLYEGYRLIRGGDPTASNAEMPPLGKYLIGLSIRYLGNGYLYGFIATTLAITAVGMLAWVLSGNLSIAIAAALLLTVDPLIVDQFSRTMLDSLQLLFLMLSLIALMLDLPAAAGILFGLCSATKFPILSPVISVVFLVFIWKRRKSFLACAVFIFSTLTGYLIPYLPYFLQGHTLGEWVVVQKYIVSFYLHGGAASTIGSELTTLLVGQQQNIFSRAWVTVPEWSLVWPIVTIGTILYLKSIKSRKANPAVVITLGIFFLFYLAIPFWTRYLVVVLPIMYIGTVVWIRKATGKLFYPIMSVLILLNIIPGMRILFPTPETMVKQFTYDLSHGFFQDVFENLSASSKTMTRDAFSQFGQQTFYDGQIEAVTVQMNQTRWSSWKSPQMVPLTIMYHTRALGSFEEQTTIPVVNDQGRWRVVWQWGNLIRGLSPNMKLKTVVDPAKRGSIRKSGEILASDWPSSMVWVIPKLVDPAKENDLLKFLAELFDNKIPGFRIHNRYAENVVLDEPIPIGVITKSAAIATLLSYPGIKLTPTYGRWVNPNTTVNVGSVANTQFTECCSLLYNTTSYGGISGLEKRYNTVLKGYNGGTLTLTTSDGAIVKTIINLPKKDGQSAQL